MLLITSTANIKTWERDNGLYGGLSPLARGTQRQVVAALRGRRFIPAGAGNTAWLWLPLWRTPVYPRWRGEHIYQSKKQSHSHGLSPLARGTPSACNSASLSVRFIPAGAGNTLVLNRPALETPVYPRWRGEHHKETILRFVQVGLSPLARGTLLQCQQSFPDCRFIPAGAGNTIEIVFGIYSEAVYPRWRGEHP